MHAKPIETWSGETIHDGIPAGALAPAMTGAMLRVLAFASGAAVMIATAAGCAKAEHTTYMRHLTTVVEPTSDIPEEVILTFNLDRKQLPQGAIAAAGEQE